MNNLKYIHIQIRNMNYRVLVVGLTDKSDGLKKPIYNVKITESAFVTLLHISMDGYNLKVLEYVLAVKQTTVSLLLKIHV